MTLTIGWTGDDHTSVCCDYCGTKVWGNNAASVEQIQREHRETCPPQPNPVETPEEAAT